MQQLKQSIRNAFHFLLLIHVSKDDNVITTFFMLSIPYNSVYSTQYNSISLEIVSVCYRSSNSSYISIFFLLHGIFRSRFVFNYCGIVKKNCIYHNLKIIEIDTFNSEYLERRFRTNILMLKTKCRNYIYHVMFLSFDFFYGFVSNYR